MTGARSGGSWTDSGRAGCAASGLKQSAADLVNVDVSLNGEWPPDERVAKADTIVIYSDGRASSKYMKNSIGKLHKEPFTACGNLFCAKTPGKW